MSALVATTVDVLGGLDIAVANAGGAVRSAGGGGLAGKGPLEDVPDEEFRRMLELNLISVFSCMKHEIPAMLASGGEAIVNMSSGSGFRAAARMGPYGTAKHALRGLTTVAALDYAQQGIRINAWPGSHRSAGGHEPEVLAQGRRVRADAPRRPPHGAGAAVTWLYSGCRRLHHPAAALMLQAGPVAYSSRSWVRIASRAAGLEHGRPRSPGRSPAARQARTGPAARPGRPASGVR